MIDSIDNTVSVSNVNGNLNLTDVVGSTSVSLVNGQIDAKVTLTINGTTDLSTVNGNVNLDIPVNTSANFSANLTNGNITVSNLVLQNPVSSPTSLSGRFGDGQGTISLGTVNGNIVVTGF